MTARVLGQLIEEQNTTMGEYSIVLHDKVHPPTETWHQESVERRADLAESLRYRLLIRLIDPEDHPNDYHGDNDTDTTFLESSGVEPPDGSPEGRSLRLEKTPIPNRPERCARSSNAPSYRTPQSSGQDRSYNTCPTLS